MTPTPEQANQVVTWLQQNWLAIVVVAIGLAVIWRLSRPLVHRAVTGLLAAQRRAFDDDVPEDELQKRAVTIEELLNKLVRGLVVLAGIFIVFGVFNLWPVVAGLGLFLAALTLAGQSIILDYLMGFLILVEGQYFKGDTISVGGLEGVVEEVGLRRTVLRDATGTVHSISNGQIRVSSNLTRLFAVAIVDIDGIRNRDVQATIELMNRVGTEVAEDPDWKDRVQEAPRYASTTMFTDLGVTMRMTGRVRPQDRWAVQAELRRRLAEAFAREGIQPNRRAAGAPVPEDPAAPVP
jgi:small conductance mechanosensitive channel